MDQSARCRIELGQVGLLAVSCVCEDGADVLGEHLAKLNSPLIETIYPIEESFSRDPMLVQREELTA